MTEREFTDQLVELAETWMGYRVLHLRPAKTKHGWRTPVQGSLGKGWPDLVLVRPGRIIAAELKSGREKPTPEQVDVLAALAAAGAETYVWRPSDFDDIVETLQEAPDGTP